MDSSCIRLIRAYLRLCSTERLALLRYLTNKVCVKIFCTSNTMIKMEFSKMLWKVLGPCAITALITFPMITGRNRAGECLMVKTTRAAITFFCSGLNIRSSVRNGRDLRKFKSNKSNGLPFAMYVPFGSAKV